MRLVALVGAALMIGALACLLIGAAAFVFAVGFVAGSLFGGTGAGIVGGLFCLLFVGALVGGSLT